MEIAKLFEYLPANIKSQIDWKLIGTNDDEAKVQLLCSFHYDTHKSAVLFYKRGNYYCSACGVSYELDDLVTISNKVKSINDLSKIKTHIKKDAKLIDIQQQAQFFMENEYMNTDFVSNGFSYEACAKLNVYRDDDEAYFRIPVIINGCLQDIRSYFPNRVPKWTSLKGAYAGHIVPYDIWMNEKTDEPTFICAGEKDMLIARSKGLNAICITGGENTLPLQILAFKGRECFILYDNDDAGRKGGLKLAKYLYNNGAKVKNVTNFHKELCEKEDIYDFFKKYNKTIFDLKKYIDNTLYFVPEFNDDITTHDHNISLYEVFGDNNDKYAYHNFQTTVQCIGADTWRHTLPSKVIVQFKDTNDKQTYDFDFEADPQKTLDLFNNLLHTKDIHKAVAKTIGKNIKNIKIDIKSEQSFYFGSVRPLDYEITANSYVTQPDIEYISNIYLNSSKIYDIKYTPIKNDYKARSTMIAIKELEGKEDYIFKPNPDNFKNLKEFMPKVNHNDDFNTRVLQYRYKVDELFNRACDDAFLTNKANPAIWEFFELVFCSPLEFVYNNNTYRAAIHACVLGDSQIGKSWTLERMINIYGHGKKLNAKTSTITAMIGGADKAPTGGYRIKAGELVFNHRGLLGIEEIHGNKEYYTKITEVKSSGRVQITRVVGSATFACLLRLIEIANPKELTNVDMYENSYDLIKELISQPEDIGRIDLFGIFSNYYFRNKITNSASLTMFKPTIYHTRTRWIWSRTAEQIKFEFDEKFLDEICKRIEDKYMNEVPMFGGVNTELRVLRLACAYAGMLVSTDVNFKNLIVRDEHLALAWKYFDTTYSKPEYQFDKAANNYKLENSLNLDDIAVYKELDTNFKFALQSLFSQNKETVNNIKDLVGYDNYAAFVNLVTNYHWAKRYQNILKPTKRLVLLMKRVKDE